MDLLWILPPVILLLGLGLVITMLRAADRAAADLRRDLLTLAEVQTPLGRTRAESQRVREALDDLAQR